MLGKIIFPYKIIKGKKEKKYFIGEAYLLFIYGIISIIFYIIIIYRIPQNSLCLILSDGENIIEFFFLAAVKFWLRNETVTFHTASNY